jgi:hypothetical protein
LRQYADECVREFQRIVQQQAQNRRSAERRGEGGERGAGEGVGA